MSSAAIWGHRHGVGIPASYCKHRPPHRFNVAFPGILQGQ